MTRQQSVEYRYFLTDLLSNEVISEVPFKEVSYARVNKRAGEFTGTIPFIEATKGLNLYEATMPGRTGLYVMRNEVCVWGGIIWSRTYSVTSKQLEVSGAEFLSYFFHRNIWQTLQYGSEFIGVSFYEVSNGVATISTEIPHGFNSGDYVRVTFVNPVVNGTHTIVSVPSSNTFQFQTSSANASGISTSGACRVVIDTFDFARDLVAQAALDLGGINFANEAIKPGKEFQFSVISRERSTNVVTLRTREDHDAIPGQEIEVLEVGSGVDGFFTVQEVPNSKTIRYELSGPDITFQSLPGIRTLNIVSKSLANNVATLTLDRPHNAFVGQTVIVDGVDSFFSTGQLDATFNGRFTIVNIPSAESFQFVSGGILPIPTSPVAGGVATFGSKFVYGDYGGFISNSDIDIAFDNFNQSGLYQDTQVLRGFEQRPIGEILEQYSNNVDAAFEYRIDCDYDFSTAQFLRTFKVFPVDLAEPPPPGEIYAVSQFGANKLVFEYPGNIIEFSVVESAEDAATRFFVVGSIEDLGDEASQPYAAASAKDLLNNAGGRSWPLLDQAETLSNIENENILYDYASDYLYEARPPMGTFTIAVNGSINPIVGEYFPGDWCSLIIEDEFVRQRLESDQEPRDDILIRKINWYKVTVPDNPLLPETVELELIPDWKVDRRRGGGSGATETKNKTSGTSNTSGGGAAAGGGGGESGGGVGGYSTLHNNDDKSDSSMIITIK